MASSEFPNAGASVSTGSGSLLILTTGLYAGVYCVSI
jgi:hypothetical protein